MLELILKSYLSTRVETALLQVILRIVSYDSTRSLRSSARGLVVVLCVRSKAGEAAFSQYVPNRWNALPSDIRDAQMLSYLKLKTFLFTVVSN